MDSIYTTIDKFPVAVKLQFAIPRIRRAEPSLVNVARSRHLKASFAFELLDESPWRFIAHLPIRPPSMILQPILARRRKPIAQIVEVIRPFYGLGHDFGIVERCGRARN